MIVMTEMHFYALGHSKLKSCSSDFSFAKMERASEIFIFILFSENGKSTERAIKFRSGRYIFYL